MDHLFLWPNKLCIVKGIDHIQASNPNLKAVWGQNVSVGYGEREPREGSVLMVGMSSTDEKKNKKNRRVIKKQYLFHIYLITVKTKSNLFTLMFKN